MDYQGNYFPDDHDENESKIYRTVKRIFKWTMYGISLLIYIILFVVLIANKDSGILEKNYFTDIEEYKDVDKDEMSLYNIHTRIFMNDDGSLQLHDIDYSDKYCLLEIGVKFNAKKVTDGEYGDSLNFELKDEKGNIYPVINIVTDKNGRYGFYRVCFSGIDIDINSNDLYYDPQTNPEPKKIQKFTLIVSRKADGKIIPVKIEDGKSVDEFIIYDNKTTFSSIDYND